MHFVYYYQPSDFWTDILEQPALNRILPSNFSSQNLGNPVQEEAGEVEESGGIEDTRKTRSSKTTEQSSYECIETEAASTGPYGSVAGPHFQCLECMNK